MSEFEHLFCYQLGQSEEVPLWVVFLWLRSFGAVLNRLGNWVVFSGGGD